MTKEKYLKMLYEELYFFDIDEKKQIIAELDSHISEKILELGDEKKAIAELDSPKQIASEYASESNIKPNWAKKKFYNHKESIETNSSDINAKLKKHTKKIKAKKQEIINKSQDRKSRTTEPKTINNIFDNIWSKLCSLAISFYLVFIYCFYLCLQLLWLLIIISNILLIIAEVIGTIIFFLLVNLSAEPVILILMVTIILSMIIFSISALFVNLKIYQILRGKK